MNGSLRSDIAVRIAVLQDRLVNPRTKRSEFGIIVGRIEELKWVLDRLRQIEVS